MLKQKFDTRKTSDGIYYIMLQCSICKNDLRPVKITETISIKKGKICTKCKNNKNK